MQKVFQKQEGMEEMFHRRQASLKKLAAKQTRPVQPVAPRPEALSKSPCPSPGVRGYRPPVRWALAQFVKFDGRWASVCQMVGAEGVWPVDWNVSWLSRGFSPTPVSAPACLSSALLP